MRLNELKTGDRFRMDGHVFEVVDEYLPAETSPEGWAISANMPWVRCLDSGLAFPPVNTIDHNPEVEPCES